MTGSVILDMFLAMAMFYLALSMVCSTLNDFVSRQLNWRAKTLTDGVRSLLLNAQVPAVEPVTGKPGAGVAELVDLFFDHPLIQTLRLQADLQRTWLSERLDRITNWFGGVWAAMTVSGDGSAGHPMLAPRTRLSSIPAPVFVQTLFEVIKPAGSQNEPLSFATLWRMIDQLPNDKAGPLKLVLKSIANDPSQDVEAVRANLAKWFTAGMDQASIWYRQRMTASTVIIAAILSIGLNIDSIEIANRFHNDASLRATYAAAGERAAPTPAGEQPGQPPAVDPLGDMRPGWGTTDPAEIWDKLWAGTKPIGLLLTIIALGMGTPFWYDVLNRLTQKKRDAEKPGAGSQQA